MVRQFATSAGQVEGLRVSFHTIFADGYDAELEGTGGHLVVRRDLSLGGERSVRAGNRLRDDVKVESDVHPFVRAETLASDRDGGSHWTARRRYRDGRRGCDAIDEAACP